MVKSKALSDPRRDRPLASQSRGVTKQKHRRERHEDQERSDTGVVGKRKYTYYTVLAGQNPPILHDKDAYERTRRAHPEAKHLSAHHRRKVEAAIKDYQRSLDREVRPSP